MTFANDAAWTSRRLLLIALSLCLHTLAFPPWNASALAWVALVPFFRAIINLRPVIGFLYGLLWGTAAIWGLGYWVPLALASYWEQPLWFGILFSMGASIIFAGSYYAAFAACACWAARRCEGISRALIFAVFWVVWELARARLLTGDPWLLLGYSLVPHPPLIQVADLGGVYLLSFVVVFFNACLGEALGATRGVAARCRLLAPSVAVLVAALVYGMVRLAHPPTADDELSVLVVQGNNDPGKQWRKQFYGEGLQQYLQLSVDGARSSLPDLIVWPESSVTFFLARETAHRQRIALSLQSTGADLILGGPHFEDPDPTRPQYFNSAFYMTGDGQLRGRYDKKHLLPFAEYFPLRTIEFLRRRFERVRYFTPGGGRTLLETRFGKIATVICFEAIFPHLVRGQMNRGAGFLINLSNDSWLGNGTGPEQHMSMVVLRAVENRTWVIRATTTGVSAFIDPLGHVEERTAISRAAVLSTRVAPLFVETFYQKYGDLFAYACLIASVLGFIILARVNPA